MHQILLLLHISGMGQLTLCSFRDKQKTFNGAFLPQPKPPAFTTNGLLDYMVEFIVYEKEVYEL